MQEYYFPISLKGINSSCYGVVLTRLFEALHLAISKEGKGGVGLSFPGWKSHSKNKIERSFGDCILVVGQDRDALMKVITRYNIDVEIDMPELVAENVLDVPLGCDRSIFKRSRSLQKQFRVAKHGEDADVRASARKRISEMEKLPTIAVRSKSTNETYLIAVERVDNVNSEEAGFSSYGLSKGSSVPVFYPE